MRVANGRQMEMETPGADGMQGRFLQAIGRQWLAKAPSPLRFAGAVHDAGRLAGVV